MKLKKDVESKGLKVGLVGEQRNTQVGRASSSGVSRSSRNGRIFSFEQPIDGEKLYSAVEKEYPFRIKIPQDLLSSKILGNGMLGTLVKSMQILSGNITSVKWFVTARLDISGLDISKKVQVNIG